MATAVKINRSQIIANDTTMHHTRHHLTQIDTVLQEITSCLDKTTAGFETKMEVLEEVVTDNLADLTTSVNTQLRNIQEKVDSTQQTIST